MYYGALRKSNLYGVRAIICTPYNRDPYALRAATLAWPRGARAAQARRVARGAQRRPNRSPRPAVSRRRASSAISQAKGGGLM
jgi:hypothetical protein